MNRDAYAKETKEKFLKDLKKKKSMEAIAGVYGEMSGSDGYVEEVIRPKEGGTFVKIYGCSYLFKGYPLSTRVFGLEMIKSVLFVLPQQVIAKSWLYMMAIGLRFLFQRKKFIHDLDYLFEEIEHKIIRHYDIPYKEYNKFGRELLRSMKVALKKEWGIDLMKPYYPVDHKKFSKYKAIPDPEDVKGKKIQLGYLLAKATLFAIMFLESDSAYRFRLQDAMHKANPIKILDRLIERESRFHSIEWKWKFIRTGLKLAFFFLPNFKSYLTTFTHEIDYKKVEMDEADWYFCLTYHSYNFGGLLFEKRLAIRREIDEEKGHVFLL